MNNEEKKAIGWLSALNIKSEYEATNKEIILNLIEKQQKEIEYWKEQAEGYSGLAKQIQEDFENRDRWE